MCLCAHPSHSEANYFRRGALFCGRAALHVWHAASANLHCLWIALANYHLALGTMSTRPNAYRVSYYLAMLQASKFLNWIFCIHASLTSCNPEE